MLLDDSALVFEYVDARETLVEFFGQYVVRRIRKQQSNDAVLLRTGFDSSSVAKMCDVPVTREEAQNSDDSERDPYDPNESDTSPFIRLAELDVAALFIVSVQVGTYIVVVFLNNLL